MAHILIADDDELIAEMATQILMDAGHACGWVSSGEEAWALLSWRRPDLLLLDQNMPGMTGVSLLRKVRQSPDHYDLPVIMLTAVRGEQDEANAIYAGANEYIRKPFDPARLIALIQRVLSALADRERHLDLKTYLAQSSGWAEDTSKSRRMV